MFKLFGFRRCSQQDVFSCACSHWYRGKYFVIPGKIINHSPLVLIILDRGVNIIFNFILIFSGDDSEVQSSHVFLTLYFRSCCDRHGMLSIR